MSQSIDNVLADAHWLCIGFNPSAMKLRFVRTTLDAIEQLVFLGGDGLAITGTVELPLADVIAGLETRPG